MGGACQSMKLEGQFLRVVLPVAVQAQTYPGGDTFLMTKKALGLMSVEWLTNAARAGADMAECCQ